MDVDKIIWKVIRRYQTRGIDNKDLYQEAVLGLIGKKLIGEGYVYKIVRSRVIDYIRKELKIRKRIGPLKNHNDYKRLYDSLNELKAIEKDIIIRIYFYGFKQKELAERYAVSQPWISQLKKKALRKIRDDY